MKTAGRLRPILLMLVILIAAAATNGVCQDNEDDQELPPFIDDSRRMELAAAFVLQGSGVSYIFLPEGPDSVNSADNSRMTLEVRYSIYFNRYKTIGLEGVFAYTWADGLFREPSDTSDPDNPVQFPVQSVAHKAFHYGGNIIYNFGYLDVVPFVTFGGGINSFKPAEDSSFPLDGTFYNMSFGGGAKYFFKEWFGLRVELSDYYFFFGTEEVNKNAHDFRVHLGGVLTF